MVVLPWWTQSPSVGMDMGPLYLYNSSFIKKPTCGYDKPDGTRYPRIGVTCHRTLHHFPGSTELAPGLHDLLQFQVGFLSVHWDKWWSKQTVSVFLWNVTPWWNFTSFYIPIHGYKATLSSVQTEAALHRHFYFFQTSPWRARSCNQKCVICKIQSVKVYPILSSIGCASIQVKTNFPVNNQHY
jgi:hypothetical protein